MKIAEKIRLQRKSLGLSQEELSKRIGVSLKTIQRWENNERSPRMEEMKKLAEGLKVSLGYLIGVEDNPEQSGSSSAQVIPIKENSSIEKNTGMAILTLGNGQKFEVPATPEGFAFLEHMYTIALGIPAVVGA